MVVVGAVVVVEVVVVGHGPVVVEGVVVAVVDGVVVLVVMEVVVADELVGGRVVVVDGAGAARVVAGAGPSLRDLAFCAGDLIWMLLSEPCVKVL